MKEGTGFVSLILGEQNPYGDVLASGFFIKTEVLSMKVGTREKSTKFKSYRGLYFLEETVPTGVGH